MEQDVTNQTRFCQIPQGSKKGLALNLKSRRIFIAVGLSFILTTSLIYYLMLPSPPPPLPPPPPPLPPPLPPQHLTPHEPIEIEWDAHFAATALLEGWPGDGSPENPFIIDGLDIDHGGERGCISISDTRVSFTISNCNLTGARSGFYELGAGITLHNVSNGLLVNNTCNNNGHFGITLSGSDSNTVANNTCSGNAVFGIAFWYSDSNTLMNNICFNNTECDIYLYDSYYNIVANNTCSGIELDDSSFNTVSGNTCSTPTTTTTTTTTTTSPTPTVPPPQWDIIGIGGGVAVAAIVLAVVFLRRR